VEPEECLRSLADDAVRRAQAGELVLHCSLGVRATVNAFVMLGLVPDGLADKILADYQEGLQQHSLGTAWGLSDGELPARSGASEVWAAHAAGAARLGEVPTAMAPAGVSFPATVSGLPADLRFEWVKLTGAEWRISFRACADDPGGEPDRPSVVMREALAMFTVTDDGGHRYRPRVEKVAWERLPPGRQEWHGDLVADIPAAGAPLGAGEASEASPRVSRRLAWLEIASAESGTAERISTGQASAEAGPRTARTAAPRWPTPAEGFLAALAKVGDVKVGWTDVEAAKTAEIVAVVADCLLAVGALPPGSAVLGGSRAAPALAVHAPNWQDALADRWARRAHSQAGSAPGSAGSPRHSVLLAPLPLAHATAVIETIVTSGAGAAAGTVVGVTLHGRPWVPGGAWPMIAPCFAVGAEDDRGNGYEGVLAGFGPGSDLEGTGTFWLWPPVADDARSLTITISTLWEGASLQLALPPSATPASPAQPATPVTPDRSA
jgi:hypothetical protein